MRPQTLLTPREAQCLQLIAWGYSTEDTGMLMGITKNTVRNHLRSAARKLGTNNQSRTASVVAALRLELISIGRPSPLGKFWKDPE